MDSTCGVRIKMVENRQITHRELAKGGVRWKKMGEMIATGTAVSGEGNLGRKGNWGRRGRGLGGGEEMIEKRKGLVVLFSAEFSLLLLEI